MDEIIRVVDEAVAGGISPRVGMAYTELLSTLADDLHDKAGEFDKDALIEYQRETLVRLDALLLVPIAEHSERMSNARLN